MSSWETTWSKCHELNQTVHQKADEGTMPWSACLLSDLHIFVYLRFHPNSVALAVAICDDFYKRNGAAVLFRYFAESAHHS